jgi:hypothetical protein
MKALREKYLAALLCAAGGVALALMSPSCSDDSDNGGQPGADAGEDAGAEPDAGGTAGIPDAGPGEQFVAFLSADQEVPPSSSTASGVAGLAFTESTGTLAYHIVHNETQAGAGHIHRGQAAVNGPVIHGFSNVSSPIVGTFVLSGGVGGADYQDLINGRLYVNLHLPAPGLEVLIRGQILRPGEVLYSGQLDDLLLGINDGGAGGAAFILSADGDTLSWNVTLTTLDGGDAPNNAHIHNKATTGVLLPTPGIGVNGGTGDGGTTPVLLDHLNNNNTYFNVHTPSMPAGRVQGDLKKK